MKPKNPTYEDGYDWQILSSSSFSSKKIVKEEEEEKALDD